MSQKREYLFRVAVLLFCFGLGEGLTAIAFRYRPRFETMRRHLGGLPGDEVQNCIGQPYLLYAPLPGYAPKGIPDHNEQGYRGKAVAMRKPAGVVRVLCLGGSTTYGWTVTSAAEAWPAELERLLAARRPEGVAAVEVINGGLPFGTSAEILTHYLFKFHYFRPDLVIVDTGGNDPLGTTRHWYQPDYSHWREQPCLPSVLPPHSRWLMRSRLASLAYMWLALGTGTEHYATVVQTVDRPPRARWYPEVGPIEPEERAIPREELAFDHNLRSVIAAVKGDGAKLLFVPFRVAPDDRFYQPVVRKWIDRDEEILRDLAREHDIPFAPFPGETISPGNWTDPCHLNAAGEREKAAHVAPYVLAALGWAAR